MEAHQLCRKCHAQAAEYALKAGRLLLAARDRVRQEGGRWLAWLKQNVRMSNRTAQRYCRLAQLEERLDRLNSGWQWEWWPTEALEMLAQPERAAESGDEEGDETADERPPDELQEDETDEDEADEGETNEGDTEEDETEEDEPDEVSARVGPATARAIAQDRRAAKALYRRSLAHLPKFLKAGHWKFRRGSAEQTALEQIGNALVRDARAAARSLRSAALTEGLDLDVAGEMLAMALVKAVMETKSVEKLFRPT